MGTLMIISMAQQRLVGVYFDVLTIWCWDLGIHPSDGLLQIVGVTDRVVAVIGLIYFWDASGGEVETSSSWRSRLYFLLFVMESDSGVMRHTIFVF